MDSSKRIDLLRDWLSKKLEIDFSISSASSDASFRSYFRIKTLEDSFIVMDAPPQNESIESFLKIGKMLNSIEVNVPHIYQEDRALGFILMQDFGNNTYLDVLNDDNQQRLYDDSIKSLIHMQKFVKKDFCPSYTNKILFDEMVLFIEWYLRKYKKIELTNKENEQLDYSKVQNTMSSESSKPDSTQNSTNPTTYLLSKKKERSLAKLANLKRKYSEEIEKIKAKGLAAGVNRTGTRYLQLLNAELKEISDKYEKSIEKEQKILDKIEQRMSKLDE